MDSLDDSTTVGTFIVVTASGSSYLLDMAARTSTRTTGQPDIDGGWKSETLRKDDAAVALTSIISCKVGAPLVLTLGGVDDYPGYAGTVRRGTPVFSITAT